MILVFSGRDVYVLTELSLEVLHYRLYSSKAPLLVSRTAIVPTDTFSLTSAQSGAELLLLKPVAGAPFGALVASTRDSAAAQGIADELLWLPLDQVGAVVADRLERLRPSRGQGLRGATTTADGLYLFAAGQVSRSPLQLYLASGDENVSSSRPTALSPPGGEPPPAPGKRLRRPLAASTGRRRCSLYFRTLS